MRVTELTDNEILIMNNLFSNSKYTLLKENLNTVTMPLFRPKVSLSDNSFTVTDELGYLIQYNDLYDISICDTLLLINSLDCTVFHTYMILMDLGNLKNSYHENLEKRIIKSIFINQFDMSDFTEKPLFFITEVLDRLKVLSVTKEILNNKQITLFVKKTEMEIQFDIWNLEDYVSAHNVDLEYSLHLNIPNFSTDIESNSLEHLMIKLYDDMCIKGVTKW